MATLDRPRVEYRTPVDLVDDVRTGVLRIPPFQRSFKWEAGDVVKLFDSLVRGYPIGNLLLWRRPAFRQDLIIGAVTVSAPEMDGALWVVDGQQRITSIVSALVAAHTATDSRFRVYIDLESGEFHTAGARQQPPAAWLPVSFLVDTPVLLRWMRENASWLTDVQIALADQAAKAIREFQIPTYVVTSPDEQALVDIFSRMNTTGKPLTKTEVFQALHSGMTGGDPADLHSVATMPAEMGFGSLDDRLALRCVLAYRGGDIFREDFREEFVSLDDRRETFREVSAALREVVAFLQGEAAIAHVKLLPYSHVVAVLVRFVGMYGPPSGRAATLLRRWVWRGAVAGALAGGMSVPDIRGQVTALDGTDPVRAAQDLLTAVPRSVGFVPELDKLHFSHAKTKINVLGLLSVGPRDLFGGGPPDLPTLLERGSPLRTIINDLGIPAFANRVVASSGSGSTIQHALCSAEPAVAESHLVDATSQRFLERHEFDKFLARRGAAVDLAIRHHVDRMAEWGARDGRSMSDILRAA